MTSKARGLTLIEMLVTLTIIVIAVSLVATNVVRQQQGQVQRAFVSSIRNAPSYAKELAISTGQTITLSFDSSLNLINISNAPPTNSLTALPTNLQSTAMISAPVATTNSDANQSLRSIPVPPGVSLDDFQLNSQDVAGANWLLHFYPDGRSETGGIQLSVSGQPLSLVIDDRGIPTLTEGSLPQPGTDTWTAGAYEPRS